MNTYEIEVGGRPLTIQHGILAQQANGSVTVRQGDTVVLVTAVMADAREGVDFFPLTVDYEERLYAVGKIPGGFPRREGRASTGRARGPQLRVPPSSCSEQRASRERGHRSEPRDAVIETCTQSAYPIIPRRKHGEPSR